MYTNWLPQRNQLLFFILFCLLVTLSPVSHAQTPQQERSIAMALFNDAQRRAAGSDFRGAVEKWEAALVIFRRHGNKKAVSVTLENLGITYGNLKDYRKAIACYEEDLAIAESLGDRKSRARILLSVGLAYLNLGDYRKAIERLEQCRKAAEELGDMALKGYAVGNLGNANLYLGEYRKAIGYLEQTLSMTAAGGDEKGKGAILGNIGTAYWNLGDYRKAVSYYSQALAIAERMKDMDAKSMVLGNIGNVYLMSNDYRKAIDCYEQALAIGTRLGARKNAGVWLGAMGAAYYGLGDIQKAIANYQQAILIADQTSDKRSKGNHLGNLGNAYDTLGDYQKSIYCLEQALAIAEETVDRQGKATTLNDLGTAYAHLGDYQQAVSYFQQAIDAYKALGIAYTLPEGNLGDAYLALDRDAEAYDIYTRQDHSIRLGRYFLKQKNYIRALVEFDRNLERFENARRVEFMISGWIGMGLAFEGIGKYADAYAWYKKAADFMEEQRMTLDAPAREHYFEGNELGIPRIEAYEGASRCAFMLNRLDEAFYWAENTRGRLLSELLSRRHAGANLKIPSGLAAEEDALASRIMINRKQQQVAFQKRNPELLKQAETEYQHLRQENDRLVARLRKEYPQYAAIRYPQPVKLSQLAQRKGETIVEYEVTEPYTIGLVIKEGRVVKGFRVNKSRTELANLVRKFRQPFQSGQHINEFSLTLAKELKELLIGPTLADMHKGERMVVIPDESLSLLPFESLLLDAPQAVLKDEAIAHAKVTGQDQADLTVSQTIIRGLSKAVATRGSASRVSTHILFDSGSARISKASWQQLEEIIAALKSRQLRDVAIRIEGNTDSIGDPGYNLKLSRKRAEAVYRQLIKGGIAASLLSYAGKGDTDPVADNGSEKGRKANRRVDLVRVPGKQERQAAVPATDRIVYAVDDYPISYYQSASVLSLQRGLRTPRVKAQTFFGLGDPVFSVQDVRSAGMRSLVVAPRKDQPGAEITGNEGTKDSGYQFGRLENTAREVKEVGRLFPDARLLIGPDASKSNLLRENLASRRYLLFSTHGILGNEIPYVKQPALVLNLPGNEREGFLTAGEIFNLSLNADLVGLSACQTGLGIQSAGEGVVGLSRAFMYAGTDSVLVSLWSVSDESTYKLMVKFFEGLKQGKDKLTALQDAKRHLRTTGYGNPFFWAPFILIGEAD